MIEDIIITWFIIALWIFGGLYSFTLTGKRDGFSSFLSMIFWLAVCLLLGGILLFSDFLRNLKSPIYSRKENKEEDKK